MSWHTRSSARQVSETVETETQMHVSDECLPGAGLKEHGETHDRFVDGRLYDDDKVQ